MISDRDVLDLLLARMRHGRAYDHATVLDFAELITNRARVHEIVRRAIARGEILLTSDWKLMKP